MSQTVSISRRVRIG